MKEETQIHKITWNKIEIEIKYTRLKYSGVISHLEIRSDCPNPITRTGYRSHFCPVGEIEQTAGSAVDYVTMWLNENSQKDEWKNYLATNLQPYLF